ncbi:MAG: hypothetical protein H0X27_09335, partial [Caulobacteraceae bacterium]|nr:hypothetical protein [Caulobacteraceae bacterium]
MQPDVAGLPERVLMIRDETVAGDEASAPEAPSWDLTLNYVPISYPTLVPAVLKVRPGRRELWRVVNGSADAITDLDLKFDGVDQPLE